MALGARRTASGVEPVSGFFVFFFIFFCYLFFFFFRAVKDKTNRSDAKKKNRKKNRARQGGCTKCMEILPFLRGVSDRFGPLIEVSCSAEQMAVSPSLVPPHCLAGQQDGTRW